LPCILFTTNRFFFWISQPFIMFKNNRFETQ